MKTYIFALFLGVLITGPCVAQMEEPKCGYGCMNGAMCTQQAGDFYCQCPPGFTGLFCETAIPKCQLADVSCLNGGTCEEESGEYYCQCSYPYTGLLCETELKDCRSGEVYCQNGGHCQDTDGSCYCPHPFTGRECETRMPMCESCMPAADQCYGAPCECQGECSEPEPEPTTTTCVLCEDTYDSHCGRPSEEAINNGYVSLVPGCPHGCHTRNGMYEGTWYVTRGCANQVCWNGCNELGECTKCCYGDYCNAMPVDGHGPITGAATSATAIAPLVTAILAVATFLAVE